MKNIIVFFFILSTTINYSQSTAKYWLNPKGEKIKNRNMRDISLKYPDFSMGFRKTKDSGLVYQNNVPTYEKSKVNYDFIKKEITTISNKTFSDSTIYVIYYHFIDDNCSSSFTNNMTKDKIKDDKIFSDFYKSKVESHKNIIYLILFDYGIILKNEINSKNEYYFTDKNNFFRNNIFKKPTLCGSFCIIKPNGETLIRNGEYRVDWMVEHLNPEIWNKVFTNFSE